MNKIIRTFAFLFVLILVFASNLFAAPNAYVAWRYVNLRETPTEDALVITKLVRGVDVTIKSEKEDWYEIETESELSGWVVKRSVKLTKELNLKKANTKKAKSVTVDKPIKVTQDRKDLLTFTEKGKGKNIAEEKAASSAVKEESIEEDEGDEPPLNDYLRPPETEMPESPSLAGAFLRMLSALFIILAIIFFLYYIGKKYFSKSLLSLEGSSAITVLASKYIGQKAVIYIIDVMEKIIVVSISGTEVKMLTEISDPAALIKMRGEIETIKENERPFKKFFGEKIKEKPGTSSAIREENFDILDDLNEKLERKVDDFKNDY